MWKSAVLAAFMIAIGPSSAVAREFALPPYEATARVYACADGSAVEAVYINLPDGLSLAIIHFGDGLTVMEIATSASGARYVSRSGAEPRRVWWTRGESAFLLEGEDGKEEMALEDCLAEMP